MPDALNYSVFGPSGALTPGMFGPLGTGESTTITYTDVTTLGLYTLFAGLDDLVITATCAEASDTPTPTATATWTASPTWTDVPTATPTPTFTPTDTPTLIPTDVPPTFTLVPFPTFTPTPPPLSLPFYDSFDVPSLAWSVNGAWTLQDATLLGGSGNFWYVTSIEGSVATLSLTYQLDLRTRAHPMLRFDSWLVSSQSIAMVEISVDGLTWQSISSVPSSANWQPILVDLSAYQQQVVWLRWIWLSQPPTNGQSADFWMVDNLIVDDAAILQPTATPTSTATATIEPSITPSPTETPTASPAPEVTEEASPNLDEDSNNAAVETATVDPLAAPSLKAAILDW